MLNMIVGVVVENFQRCRERLEDKEKQRRRRKMPEKARNKNQQGGYYLPFAHVVLRLQFQPLGIISYARWFSRYVIAAMLVDGKQKIAH